MLALSFLMAAPSQGSRKVLSVRGMGAVVTHPSRTMVGVIDGNRTRVLGATSLRPAIGRRPPSNMLGVYYMVPSGRLELPAFPVRTERSDPLSYEGFGRT